jgi:hypothetical protein
VGDNQVQELPMKMAVSMAFALFPMASALNQGKGIVKIRFLDYVLGLKPTQQPLKRKFPPVLQGE